MSLRTILNTEKVDVVLRSSDDLAVTIVSAPAIDVLIATGNASATGHGHLTGLSGDDHPQYLTRDISLVAGESLSALRAVSVNAAGKAIYAGSPFVGVTRTAASADAAVTVRTHGVVSDALLSLDTNKKHVYVGASGALTQDAPLSGSSTLIGVTLSATSFLLQPQPTITLA